MYFLTKKATINWCEDDYIYSNYIAELYNSLTGVFLCLSPLLFYYHSYKVSNWYGYGMNLILYNDLKNCFYLIFLVGVGTVLFHGTLLYVFQLLDEIPMLLLCFEYYTVLKKLITVKWYYNITKNDKAIALYKCTICFVVIASGYINDGLQVLIFQLTILLSVINLLYKLYILHLNTNKIFINLIQRKTQLQSILLYNYSVVNKISCLKNTINILNYLKRELHFAQKISILTGVLSIVVWQLDNNYCMQFILSGHSIWHILTSISLYYVNKIIVISFNIKKQSSYNML